MVPRNLNVFVVQIMLLLQMTAENCLVLWSQQAALVLLEYYVFPMRMALCCFDRAPWISLGDFQELAKTRLPLLRQGYSKLQGLPIMCVHFLRMVIFSTNIKISVDQ